MEKLVISTEYIRLDQLLKFANIADSGGFAKIIIKEGMVSINGDIVLQRGKKVYPGDILKISYEDESGNDVTIALEITSE